MRQDIITQQERQLQILFEKCLIHSAIDDKDREHPMHNIFIVRNGNYSVLPKPSVSQVERFSAAHFPLPDDYSEFVRKYGASELGSILRIAAPLDISDDVFNLADLNRIIHDGDWLLAELFANHPFIANACYFAATYGGDFLAWERAHLGQHASPGIYAVPRNSSYGISQVAVSFSELIDAALNGQLPAPIGHLQVEEEALRNQFMPAYTITT